MSPERPDLKALHRATELRPGDPAAHAALVVGLHASSAEPAAVIALDAALNNAIGAFARAWEVQQPELDRSVEEALAQLESVFDQAPHGVRVRLVHASLLAQRVADDNTALGARIAALLDAALALDGFAPEALFGAATLALHVGRATDVVRWFDAHGAPGAEGLALFVVAKLQLGDAHGALATGHGGLVAAPESVLLLNAMASASLAVGQTVAAETFVSRALELAPGRIDVLLNLAATHEQAARPAAALGVLDGLADAGKLPPPYDAWRIALRESLAES